MYNIGLTRFIESKELNSKEAINGFLKYKGITKFTANNHYQVNDFIQNNWNSFSSYVDRELKNGNLNGKRVKLNTYYDEHRKYIKQVKDEVVSSDISKEEQRLLNKIKKEYSVGFLQSFLMKRDIQPLGKDISYFSKNLQWLPLVRQAIDAGILKQLSENIIT
jgi:hypothetical protein